MMVGRDEYQQFCEFQPPDQSWYARKHEYDGRIVECKTAENDPTKWVFMRFREDKNTPNHVSVVPKILKSIEEGVAVDEVFSIVHVVF